MTYRLEDVPGLSEAELAFFLDRQLYTTGALLQLQRTPGIDLFAGLDLSAVERLREICDRVALMHLPGMGPERAEALIAVGIHSIAQLREMNAASLACALDGLEYPPSAALAALWIATAAAETD